MLPAPPPGLAKFDSAAGMVQALANCLHGRSFPRLGQPRSMRLLGMADYLPRRWRQDLFARLGAEEGLRPEQAGTVDTDAVARWVAGLYPRRHYPAIMIGSANGALLHLAAALGIPWLPQTFLTLIQQKGIDPDEPMAAMKAAGPAARRFLDANPRVDLHHMHDPNQHRLMLGYITYFRWKYRGLPSAYWNFIEESLLPGGAILIADCTQHWPVTRLGERHVFQFGANGGVSIEEYFSGGSRVAGFFAARGDTRRQWHPPKPDDFSPEAEWGFAPEIRQDLAALTQRGFGMAALEFDDPAVPSPVIADLYHEWLRQRGSKVRRLLVDSFVLLDPYRTLGLEAVPFWMVFNMTPSLEAVSAYLDHSPAFDDIHMTLFAHGADAIGLPPIEAWRKILERAVGAGTLLGVNERTYPAHFSTYARYHAALAAIPGEDAAPEPLDLRMAIAFIKSHRQQSGLRLRWLGP
ncbi:MAG TPA: hypothetical protein VL574_10990 [Stellaceae bacterium]|jgi:hypothetical protein|nr:hypothetical protein [Stellaceae bacterium]